MVKKQSLYEEIKKFQREKKLYFLVLIFLGLLGLIFPVIPGLLLIGLGITLMAPQYGEAAMKKVKNWWKSLTANI